MVRYKPSEPAFAAHDLGWLVEIAERKSTHLPNLLCVGIREKHQRSCTMMSNAAVLCDPPPAIDAAFREADIGIKLHLRHARHVRH